MSETITNLIAEAQETRGAMDHHNVLRLADACEQLQANAAEHQRLLRKAALLDAAGDVCGYCLREVAPLEEEPEVDDGRWFRHANVWLCSASPIHRRIKEEGL